MTLYKNNRKEAKRLGVNPPKLTSQVTTYEIIHRAGLAAKQEGLSIARDKAWKVFREMVDVWEEFLADRRKIQLGEVGILSLRGYRLGEKMHIVLGFEHLTKKGFGISMKSSASVIKPPQVVGALVARGVPIAYASVIVFHTCAMFAEALEEGRSVAIRNFCRFDVSERCYGNAKRNRKKHRTFVIRKKSAINRRLTARMGETVETPPRIQQLIDERARESAN